MLFVIGGETICMARAQLELKIASAMGDNQKDWF